MEINLFANKEDYSERRKHNRFNVKEGGLVFINSEPAIVGKIADISLVGMAFFYVQKEGQVCDEYELHILFAEDSFFLDIDKFRTILDFEIHNDTESSSYPTRRQSVEFCNLNVSQKYYLEYFIRFHTTTS